MASINVHADLIANCALDTTSNRWLGSRLKACAGRSTQVFPFGGLEAD
jgi:hypothetical protein